LTVSETAAPGEPASVAAVSPSPPHEVPEWRVLLGIGLLAVLVYAPSLAGGFLYDDLHTVVGNRHIRDLRALSTVLRYEPARPLLGLAWALNYAVAGLEPWPYHAVNILLHGLNAALATSLFLWLARRARAPREPAIFAAALFAVTPMAAETIAYVSSRSTALCALFMLASLRLGADALLAHAPRRVVAALGCAVLAFASKEEAAALPLLLLAIDVFFVAGRSERGLQARLPVHLAFWLLPTAGLAARAVVTGTLLPPPALPVGPYLLTQAAAFPLYFLRALFPLDPALYREHPVAPWPPDAATTAWLLAAAGLAAVAVVGWRRSSSWSFAVVWLAAALLPSSSFVPLTEMVVDHRAYLGGAGVLFASAALLWRWGGLRLALAVLLLLALRAVHYQWILADPARVWEDAVRRLPRSASVRLNLSEAYLARDDPRAEEHLRQGVALAPGDPRLWTNLGALYVARGRLHEAEDAMRRAVTLAPFDARLRNNLAIILRALGRNDEALRELQGALEVNPRLAQVRIDLADLLVSLGRVEEARSQLAEAARLEIDEEDARALEAVRARIR
jgi:tetratricopeptide (TPR) repeat protein